MTKKQTKDKFVIEASDVSTAWANVLLEISKPGKDSHPICVIVKEQGNKPPRIQKKMHTSVNAFLEERKKEEPKIVSIEETASTIFPYKKWEMSGRIGVRELKEWYVDTYLKKYKARCSFSKETYFERMVNYQCVVSKKNNNHISQINQLEFLINKWNTQTMTPSKSEMQLSCFDPGKDHKNSRGLKFPCLQQLGFWINGGQLTLSAFYTTQYIDSRAYGNYYGLIYLGKFIAEETSSQFHALRCMVSNPILEATKKSLTSTLNTAEQYRIKES